jgi:hypothetical protein
MNGTRANTERLGGALGWDRQAPPASAPAERLREAQTGAREAQTGMSPVSAEKLFRAMVLHKVSRNKDFNSFAYEGFRRVLRRYRVVRSLQREAERLAGLPGSSCRVRAGEGVLQVCLESPTLQYRREVVLLPYEWEWLGVQTGIRTLLAATGDSGAEGVDGVVP